MDPHEGLTGIRTPVPKQPILNVLWPQRLAEEGIRAKIDHARRQIIAGSPIGIHLPYFFERKGRQDFRCDSHGCSPRLECVLDDGLGPADALVSLNGSDVEANHPPSAIADRRSAGPAASRPTLLTMPKGGKRPPGSVLLVCCGRFGWSKETRSVCLSS